MKDWELKEKYNNYLWAEYYLKLARDNNNQTGYYLIAGDFYKEAGFKRIAKLLYLAQAKQYESLNNFESAINFYEEAGLKKKARELRSKMNKEVLTKNEHK